MDFFRLNPGFVSMELASGYQAPCGLCEERPSKVYCKNCGRSLCPTCHKAHIKTTACEAKHAADGQEEKLGEVIRELDKHAQTLTQRSQWLTDSMNKVMQLTNKTTQDYLHRLKVAEEEAVKAVKLSFQQQRTEAVRAHEEQNNLLTGQCAEMVKCAEHMIESMASLKSNTKGLLGKSGKATSAGTGVSLGFGDTLLNGDVSVKPPMTNSLALFRPGSAVALTSGMNNLSLAGMIEPKKPLALNNHAYTGELKSVELGGLLQKGPGLRPSSSATLIGSSAEADRLKGSRGNAGASASKKVVQFPNSFEGCLASLKSASLQSDIVNILFKEVLQLQLVSGQVWALTDTGIMIFSENSPVSETIDPGFVQASDMCAVKSGHVIVSTLKSGLHVLNLEGKVVQHINDGKYWSVTSGDEVTFWAVKQEGGEMEPVSICHYSITGDEFILDSQLKTMIRSGKDVYDDKNFVFYSSLYCTMLDEKMCISSFSNHCIYIVDTRTGCTLGTYGEHGQPSMFLSRLGKLFHPLTIYSDQASRSLVVLDSFNNRVQVLDLATNGWSLIKVDKDVKKPTAAAVDEEGCVWIAGSGSAGDYCLFKFVNNY